MNRYKCLVEYDGTSFVGWQRQLNGYSVQEAIEESLESIFKKKIRIFGSSRTDAGVHAKGQVMHFDAVTTIDEKKITHALNHYLQKKNISIINTQIKDNDFDSRRNAKMRTYEYLILNRNSPPAIMKNKAWHVSNYLNFENMKRGVNFFLGIHDFTTFRSSSCEANSPIRKIENSEIHKDKEQIIISFKSRSFLQYQVRSMVGALKLIGEEKWTIKDLQLATKALDRSKCAKLAPPCGLYLVKVEY